jgi:RHS repeat-associated protein
MKPAGASRWIGFCFYTSAVPLHNNENRLSCEQKKAPSFDGYPWRPYLLSATAPAGTTHVSLNFVSGQYYDDLVFSTTAPPAVPSSHHVGTCAAGHAECPTHFESDPVNTATGNYVSAVTDLWLPGAQLGFAFTRTYNSLVSSGDDLGRGWRHSFSARLTVNGDGSVRVYAEDGASYLYTADGAGGFEPPVGGRSVLTSVPNGYQLTRADQLRYRFSDAGALVALSDRTGNEIALAYAGGLLSTITDTVGRVLTVSHDGAGRISGISAPLGRQVGYEYDGSGRLTAVTDMRGGIWTYGYDAENRLVASVDPEGNTVLTNEYGPDGRISAQTDAVGNRGTFAWDAGTAVSTYTDARGGVWLDDYEDNRLIARTDPLGNVVTYGYDADLNVTSITDGRGNTTTSTYDARGNLLTKTAPPPLGYTQVFSYNSFGDILTATDGRGNTTTSEYDATGNLVRVTEPGGSITNYSPNTDTGLVQSVTDALGQVTTYAYDAHANLTSVTDALGNTVSMSFDELARLTSSVDPRGNEPGADPDDYRTTFAYDGELPREVTDPLDASVTTTYDALGNVLSVTDALGKVTNYSYDAASRLTTVTDPDGHATTYDYDAVGNLVARTDASGHITSYEYDLAKHLVSSSDPLGNDWVLTHDGNGNVVTYEDPRGQTRNYVYDALNRLTSINYGPAGTPDVAMAYDASGNLTELADGAGTETYSYDSGDRLTSVVRATDTFTYSYDVNDNLTSRTSPDDTVTAYAYDPAGRLSTATVFGQTTTYAYDAAGNPVRTVTPDGVTAVQTFDAAGRLVEVAHVTETGTLSRFTYGLDDAGRRTSVTTALGSASFLHDDRGQLVEACFVACPSQAPVPALPCIACVGAPLNRPAPDALPDPADTFVRYTYDPTGNRLTQETHLGTTAYAYDVGDRLTTVTPPTGPTQTYGYDANGNQTAAGIDTFSWDAADRLSTATVAGTSHGYAYSGDGRRLSATADGNTTEFLWDLGFALPMLAAERDSSGAIRSYAYGADLLAQATSGVATYYHHDAVGSVVDVTDSAGASLAWTEYAPFGDVRAYARSTAPFNPFGFTGEYQDVTGTYHLRARQYDPDTGRFLSQDPASQPLSDPHSASYVYVRNMALNAVDPSGECIQQMALALFGPPGAVAGGVSTAVCFGLAALLGTAAVSGTVAVANEAPPLEIHWDPRPDPQVTRRHMEMERQLYSGPDGSLGGGRPSWCAQHRARCLAYAGITLLAVEGIAFAAFHGRDVEDPVIPRQTPKP